MDYNKHIAKHFNKLTCGSYTVGKCEKSSVNALIPPYYGYALYGVCSSVKLGGKCDEQLSTLVSLIYDYVRAGGYLKGENAGIKSAMRSNSILVCALFEYYAHSKDNEALYAAREVLDGFILPNAEKLLGDMESAEGEREGGCTSNCFYAVRALANFLAFENNAAILSMIERFANLFKKLGYANFESPAEYIGAVMGFMACGDVCGADIYKLAKDKFTGFLLYGMTANYEAKEGFGGGCKQTDPCATIDAFIVALRLYRKSGDVLYRTLARRIWFNGLQFCFRYDGGVGKNTAVLKRGDLLCVSVEQCPYDCTPYYACALLGYAANKALFSEGESNVFKDGEGRFICDDKIFVRDHSGFFGRDLIEIPPLSSFDEETGNQLQFQVLF